MKCYLMRRKSEQDKLQRYDNSLEYSTLDKYYSIWLIDKFNSFKINIENI